ncbi:MAG: 16S rRNA (cytosine(1402)-N(4))-methyltransferase RsmH [Eubacteriales bacterium]
MPEQNGQPHIPVLFGEVMEHLSVKKDGTYVDCTCGFGGHSGGILERLDTGRLIALDQDINALEYSKIKLAKYADKITFVNDNFRNAGDILDSLGITSVDGALLDLGVSSVHLDDPSRGFSYNTEGPLDMRMSESASLDAYQVVNGYSKEQLSKVIFDYGEERYARQIAGAIEHEREKSAIESTTRLAEIIKQAIPAKAREGGPHPARRTFQAIRIEVNAELDVIAPAISSLFERLSKGGRIAVITFHSLEDRIVKQSFASFTTGCTCPPDFPVCVCGKSPRGRLVTRKPLTASEQELEINPRSRSAKLRVIEKL